MDFTPICPFFDKKRPLPGDFSSHSKLVVDPVFDGFSPLNQARAGFRDLPLLSN
jgi:hypothetical protein